MANEEIKIRETDYNKPLIEQRADPYIYKHTDGWYYFTASVPAFDRIILRRAKTIAGLASAEEYTLWEKHETGIMGNNVWAPEIHFLDGKWYIYFAAGEAENQWKIRPYVLECKGDDPVTGEWIEKGKMQRADEDEFSFEDFSLDGTVFESKGRRYYIWAEKVGVGKQISNLYIAEMENPCKLKTVQVLLSTPDYDWERNGYWVNEGPAVLKKNGRIFVTFSASATDASYCIGMLWANEDDDLLDPRSWNKSRYPVLKTDEEKGFFGPGHNSFTVSETGKELMVFHARQYPGLIGSALGDPNRHTYILEIKWNDDGTPRFEYMKQK